MGGEQCTGRRVGAAIDVYMNNYPKHNNYENTILIKAQTTQQMHDTMDSIYDIATPI